MITAGGVTARSSSAVSAPSVSTRASWTILTTIWPGVTERSTSWPTAFSVTWSTKSRATGSATSASSRATRTSRIAARTSASLSAPRPRSRSNTLPSRSLNVSNIQISSAMRRPMGCETQNTPADETSSAGVHPWALTSMSVLRTRRRLAAARRESSTVVRTLACPLGLARARRRRRRVLPRPRPGPPPSRAAPARAAAPRRSPGSARWRSGTRSIGRDCCICWRGRPHSLPSAAG